MQVSDLPEGYVYVIAADGSVLKRYDYDAVIDNGLPIYLWPEGAQIKHRPTDTQYIRWLQAMYYPAVGPVVNV